MSWRQHLAGLCQVLVDRVSEDELRSICGELGIAYDSLPSRGHAGRARELVKKLDHSGSLSKLVDAGARVPPELTWPETPVTEMSAVDDCE